MKLQKMFTLLILPLCLFTVSACASSKAPGSPKDDKKETTEVLGSDEKAIVVSTKLGSVSYSDQWDGLMEADVKEEGDAVSIHFQTTLNDKSYALFDVEINDEEGGNATIVDANGKKHQVHIKMAELDVEGLSEQEANRLFAMQEEVNYLLEQL